jgi:[acyl-carrier-protein] S-malonyltransferase
VTGYLFGDELDPVARFELVARRPLLYDAGCFAVGVNPFMRVDKDCRFTQPALVALLLAQWAETDDGLASTIVVGEGAGEIAALAVAGALSPYDAIWLAAVRGRLMSRVVSGSRLVSLALRDVTIRTARQVATSHDLRVARDAAPEEVVVTGRRELVDVAQRSARKLGIDAFALPAYRVFPSADFAAVRREWRAALHAVEMQPPKRPVLSCTTVGPVVSPRASLSESLTAAIRVRQSRTLLRRLGVGRLDVIPTVPA